MHGGKCGRMTTLKTYGKWLYKGVDVSAKIGWESKLAGVKGKNYGAKIGVDIEWPNI